MLVPCQALLSEMGLWRCCTPQLRLAPSWHERGMLGNLCARCREASDVLALSCVPVERSHGLSSRATCRIHTAATLAN
jgi:hypothetical protein